MSAQARKIHRILASSSSSTGSRSGSLPTSSARWSGWRSPSSERDRRAQRGRRVAGPVHRRHGAPAAIAWRGGLARRPGAGCAVGAAPGARRAQGLRRAAGRDRRPPELARAATRSSSSTSSSGSSARPHKPPARLRGDGAGSNEMAERDPWPAPPLPISFSAWRLPPTRRNTAPRPSGCSAERRCRPRSPTRRPGRRA